MKGFLSKKKALFLAVLVLVSSSFISVDTHYCYGKKVDSTFFGKVDVCNMDMITCKNENISTTIIKGYCCHNTNVSKFGKVFKKNSCSYIDFEDSDFTQLPQFAPVSNLFIETEIDNNYFKDYSPPLVTKNILVLVQCFLI